MFPGQDWLSISSDKSGELNNSKAKKGVREGQPSTQSNHNHQQKPLPKPSHLRTWKQAKKSPTERLSFTSLGSEVHRLLPGQTRTSITLSHRLKPSICIQREEEAK